MAFIYKKNLDIYLTMIHICTNLNMNQILRKLLNRELSINDVSLEDFLKGRKIYKSYKDAKKEGFEAEHIYTLSIQRKNFNEKNNTSYSSRSEFIKNVDNYDDRCYRLTPLEHIICHYLKAKSNENEIYPFECMIRLNFNKLPSKNDEIIKLFEDMAEIRIRGRQKDSENKKGKPCHNKGKTMKEITGNLNYQDPKKGKTMKEITGDPNWVSPNLGKKPSEETRKKLSLSHKTDKCISLAIDHFKIASEANRGKSRNQEVKNKISDSKRKNITIITSSKEFLSFKGLDIACKTLFSEEKFKSAYCSLVRTGYYKGFFLIKKDLSLLNRDNIINKINEYLIFKGKKGKPSWRDLYPNDWGI